MDWKFDSWMKYVCISMGLFHNHTSGHAHGSSRGILNTHGLPSKQRSPTNTIKLPLRTGATKKSLNKSFYFSIEWNSFNYLSPFTIQCLYWPWRLQWIIRQKPQYQPSLSWWQQRLWRPSQHRRKMQRLKSWPDLAWWQQKLILQYRHL